MQTHTITLKARVFSDEEEALVKQGLELLASRAVNAAVGQQVTGLLEELEKSGNGG